MTFSKLDLSPHELSLLTEPTLWDARRNLNQRVLAWMGSALDRLKAQHGKFYIDLLNQQNVNGKITRGDNYNGYPYLLLDYPNHFSKREIVAARNMVWFGQGLHCTLHVRGERVLKVAGALRSNDLDLNGLFVCVSDNEWLHHVDAGSWKPVAELDEATLKLVPQQGWIKLGTTVQHHEPEHWLGSLVSVYDKWTLLV